MPPVTRTTFEEEEEEVEEEGEDSETWVTPAAVPVEYWVCSSLTAWITPTLASPPPRSPFWEKGQPKDERLGDESNRA